MSVFSRDHKNWVHGFFKKYYGNQFLHCVKMKLYALNEKENRKHPSCVAIPPTLWKISMPSCDARKKLRWLLPAVEFYAWCKTTWNKGGVENE